MSAIQTQSRFSWLFDAADSKARPEWDRVLWETPEFAVLPSLGSLVPGWLLVIPKRPLSSLSQLSSKEIIRLHALVSEASERLKIFSGTPQVFEHGGPWGSMHSCGADQAHLHVVPLEFDLVELVRSTDCVVWSSIRRFDELKYAVKPSTEYLYVSGMGKALLGLPKRPTSQWFRRTIAKRMGFPEEWNYRDFPRLDVVNETLSRLAA